MKKLFEKSEIWFAVLWIVLYVLGFSNGDSLSEAIGIPKLLTVLIGAVLTAVLYGFIRKEGLQNYLGLCKGTRTGKEVLYFLPLILMSTVNFWNGITLNLSWTETVLYIISMCFVGFLEEVIFRGLLFRAMGGSASRSAILVAALTFGMGHAVNLLLGEPVLDTLLQLVYASAIGFCFIAVFCVSGTIWPCILAHVFINSTSVFAVQPSEGKAVAMALVQTLLGVAYGSWLFYHSKKTGSKLFAREPNASVPVFRLAKASEQERIMEIYSSVKGTEFCVWDPDYPGPAEWKQDFETGNLFVLEERGRIAAAISVLPENELFDLGIWPKELEAFEFARVAVSPEYQGRGFAALMVQNVEAVVKERGGKRIHILAAPGNLPAVKTYEKLGYRTVGECFAYGHDYLAMEKELQQAGSPANR